MVPVRATEKMEISIIAALNTTRTIVRLASRKKQLPRIKKVDADAPIESPPKMSVVVAPLNVKVLLTDIVTQKTADQKGLSNILFENLRGNGWKFAKQLLDYREKRADKVIRGSLG